MSQENLRKATAYIVKRAGERKKTKKKQKDSQARADAEKVRGQMLVINKEHQSALIFRKFKIRLSLGERNKLYGVHGILDTYLKWKETSLKMSAAEKKAAQAIKPSFKKKPGDLVYVISNFEAAKRLKFKTSNPDDASKVQANYLNSLERNQEHIEAVEISALSQVAHGDRGLSASQYGVDRAISEAKEKFNLTDTQVEQLVTVTTKQRKKHKMKVNFSHSQIFTKKGKFKKNFRFVLSSQDGLKNDADRLIEQAVLKDTLKDMDILGLKTSTLVPDAIAQIILENIAGKKLKNKRVTGKRKKIIKESVAGSLTQEREEISTVAYGAQRGLSTKGVKKRKAIQRDRTSIVNLIGILSNKIKNTVAKNMGTPALVYRSGDFANSVEITDVTMTPQGFPSVGYTYDKYPYQTFEPGYAQGSPQRDPRKLIDASIREIAMGLAIGRFYTRRI
jgi:hypothetical protein